MYSNYTLFVKSEILTFSLRFLEQPIKRKISLFLEGSQGKKTLQGVWKEFWMLCQYCPDTLHFRIGGILKLHGIWCGAEYYYLKDMSYLVIICSIP